MIRNLTFCAFAVTLMLGVAKADICDGIAGNLVANCGFETGTFADWTISSYGAGQVSSYAVNSGNFAAWLYPGGENTLSQTISDSAGSVTLNFWLENSGGTPSNFSAQWDGTTIFGPLDNPGTFPYTDEGPFVLSSTGSDTLQFMFLQLPGYWALDDISVVQTTTSVPETSSIVLLFTLLVCVGLRLLCGRASAESQRTD